MAIDLTRPVSPAPLATFRIGFGLMMCLSLLRFWYNGWIEKLYLEPAFHFSYAGFAWVKPLGEWTYLLFAVAVISALLIAAGRLYRPAAIVFFLSWTYIELMDKTTYLNHYYLVSILAFLLIFLPADACYTLGRARRCKADYIEWWTIGSLQLTIAVVYCYAGLAKLNSDWLLEAMPLSIWLPGKYDIPLLGDLLQQRWVHYAFSWTGAAYDLAIPFLLWWPRTRVLALVLVIVFHLLTRVLFPIGMFPYVMIVSALIFFGAETHQKWLSRLPLSRPGNEKTRRTRWAAPVVCTVLILHLLLPWRYLIRPGELFWTEDGYRFSWRVMLMEKAGLAQFTVLDGATGERWRVSNDDFLTVFQEKQLSTQPDFILEFARFLGERSGYAQPRVYVESYVALNGRLSQPYVDPKVDLLTISSTQPRTEWLLPFGDTIHGL